MSAQTHISIHLSKWTFTPDVMKFPLGISREWDINEVTAVTFDHQNLVNQLILEFKWMLPQGFPVILHSQE